MGVREELIGENELINQSIADLVEKLTAMKDAANDILTDIDGVDAAATTERAVALEKRIGEALVGVAEWADEDSTLYGQYNVARSETETLITGLAATPGKLADLHRELEKFTTMVDEVVEAVESTSAQSDTLGETIAAIGS